MTFPEYLHVVAGRKAMEPSWRMGQTYFNVLREERPDLANKIRATAYDPFYNDELIGDCLTYLCSHWNAS
jgi:hypothetical protein